MIAAADLQRMIDWYFGHTSKLRMATLMRTQHRPYGQLGFGALGIAYAHWRASHLATPALHLAEASRWLAAVNRVAERQDTWITVRLGVSTIGSVAYHRPGAAALSARVALSRGDRRAGQLVDDFLTMAVRVTNPQQEAQFGSSLLCGTAGRLLTTLSFLSPARVAGVRDAAERIVEMLLAPARARRWQRSRQRSFGLGSAGIVYALLQAALKLDISLPPGVFATLEDLDRNYLEGVPAGMMLSWCNGVAGLAVMWAKAYKLTSDRRYLARARAAGRRLARAKQFPGTPQLCCGATGHAYAMLELARIDRQQPWRSLAEDRAATAINAFHSTYPHGLLRGWPGVICLALDLLAPIPRGFPLLDD